MPGDYSGKILGTCSEMFWLPAEGNRFIEAFQTLQVGEDRWGVFRLVGGKNC